MNGFLVVNKPKGVTSHDVVKKVKRAINAKKVGHTGTLDPFATGVLLLCINEATSLARFFESDVKEYVAVMKLGEETDTYDLEGRITAKNDVSPVREDDIVSVLKGFEGSVLQVPPIFSALKKNGIPLYKFARQGIDIEREPRTVNIYEVEVMEASIPYVKFRVVCSKGTYIRSMCHDAGKKLGCGAHLVSLERIRNGRFSLGDSLDIESVSMDKIISLEEMFKELPAVFVDEADMRYVMNGMNPERAKISCSLYKDGTMIKYIFLDRIIALGHFDGDRFKWVRIFKSSLN